MLYHNLGNGHFADVSKSSGIEKNGHYCFSVSTLDYNDDGWPDIYIACDSTPGILYRNNHDGTFTDVAEQAGAAYDGRISAVVNNMDATLKLLVNLAPNSNHWLGISLEGTPLQP